VIVGLAQAAVLFCARSVLRGRLPSLQTLKVAHGLERCSARSIDHLSLPEQRPLPRGAPAQHAPAKPTRWAGDHHSAQRPVRLAPVSRLLLSPLMQPRRARSLGSLNDLLRFRSVQTLELVSGAWTPALLPAFTSLQHSTALVSNRDADFPNVQYESIIVDGPGELRHLKRVVLDLEHDDNPGWTSSFTFDGLVAFLPVARHPNVMISGSAVELAGVELSRDGSAAGPSGPMPYQSQPRAPTRTLSSAMRATGVE